jgi:transcriptional regulator with XRE-family HTH domain
MAKEKERVSQQQQQRLQELGDFLSTRRARLAPEQVGLPHGSRRRTPGLRRAEVAQLAGVSADWYTWLEQGRPIKASAQVLENLVQIFQLDANERKHLFFLAHQQPPPEISIKAETVSTSLQYFLDHQGINPAFVSGRGWDIVAWNEAACVVFGDFRLMTIRECNKIWRVFTEPSYRHLFVDWEKDARRMLAQFRASCGRFPGDPRLMELVHDLMLRSPEFQAWWPDHEVHGAQEGQKRLNHPQAGHLMFDRLTFQAFDAPDLNVTVYSPLDETDTATKLAQLLQERQKLSLIKLQKRASE